MTTHHKTLYIWVSRYVHSVCEHVIQFIHNIHTQPIYPIPTLDCILLGINNVHDFCPLECVIHIPSMVLVCCVRESLNIKTAWINIQHVDSLLPACMFYTVSVNFVHYTVKPVTRHMDTISLTKCYSPEFGGRAIRRPVNTLCILHLSWSSHFPV